MPNRCRHLTKIAEETLTRKLLNERTALSLRKVRQPKNF